MKEKSKPKKAKIEDKYGQMQKQPHVLKSVVRIQEWICKNTALVLSEEKNFFKKSAMRLSGIHDKVREKLKIISLV